MSKINFFSGALYKKGSIIEFPLSTSKPDCTKWIIEEKHSHSNDQLYDDEIGKGGTSYAVGTFHVHNDENIHAYMRVYLQVPIVGTEFAPANERASQATRVEGEHTEITAVKALDRQHSTITPSLLAISEGLQGEQGLVPGGYVTRIVFERVEGVRLAEDQILPEYRSTPHTFLREYSQLQRDDIREIFYSNYQYLKELGWEPSFGGATHLVWNAKLSKLSVFDRF